MKFYKPISIFIVVCILLTLSTPALATEYSPSTEANTSIETEIFDEYTYISLLQKSNSQELHDMGLTPEEANMVVSEFEKALMERASLPDDQLKGLGYNEEEIAIFRRYLDGATLSESDLRAITAVCTGKITRYWVTQHAARFSYSWKWDSCPIITLADSAAMRWIAYDKDGNEIGVIQKDVDLSVNYHYQVIAASGPIAYTSPGTAEENLDFNTINMQFQMYGAKNTQDCYAGSGEVKVKIEVPDGNTQKIAYIFVAGIYGHTILGLTSPSVSVGNKGSVAVGFSGNVGCDSIASIKVTIYENKEEVEEWES